MALTDEEVLDRMRIKLESEDKTKEKQELIDQMNAAIKAVEDKGIVDKRAIIDQFQPLINVLDVIEVSTL